MPLFLLIAVLAQYLDPGIQWQVPFSVEKTGLSPSGTSAFVSKGIIYIYTHTGNLIHEFPIETQVEYLWLDDEDHIWCLSENQLTIFSPQGEAFSSSEIQTLIAPPFFMRNCSALVSTNGIRLIRLNHQITGKDKEEPICDIDLEFEHIFSTGHTPDQIFICDTSGRSLIWYPFEGVSYPFQKAHEARIRFFSASQNNSIAQVYEDRTLFVQSMQKKWKRTLPLDINQSPLWLYDGKNEALVVISEARVFRVFKANGLEINRKLLSYRPKTLVQLDNSRALVGMYQSDTMLIYDYSQNKFHIESLQDPLIDLVKNGNFLLLLNRVGHIKLKKIVPDPIEAESKTTVNF